jgi:endonuclease/exonuclease/phosphatase family metal-dependent hydrolase
MFKLITWNIQWCRGCDGRVDPRRIAAHARALADFDILCLQEVARNFPQLQGSSGEDQFAMLAAELPEYTAIEGVATDLLAADGSRRHFGNMIFSRLPVRQVFRHLLPWPAQAGVDSMQRIALEVVVDGPAGPLRVITTHLEYYSALQRAAQVERLRELHAEDCAHARTVPVNPNAEGPFATSPRPASAILTADFNFRGDDPLHERISAPFANGTPAFRDAWQTRYPGVVQPDTLGVHDRAQWGDEHYCCDFIYVTEDLAPQLAEVRVDSETTASDHQPVMLALER